MPTFAGMEMNQHSGDTWQLKKKKNGLSRHIQQILPTIEAQSASNILTFTIHIHTHILPTIERHKVPQTFSHSPKLLTFTFTLISHSHFTFHTAHLEEKVTLLLGVICTKIVED